MRKYLTTEERQERSYRRTRLACIAGFVLVALGCALLGWVGVAEANGQFGLGRPFGEAELAKLAEAEAYWGRQPENCVSEEEEVVAPGALGTEDGHDVAARATQATYPSRDGVCLMWVEEDALGFGLCSVIRHEYGHWLGYSHQDPELAQMPTCPSDVPSTEPPDPPYPPNWQETNRLKFKKWQLHWYRCLGIQNKAHRRKCFRRLGPLSAV